MTGSSWGLVVPVLLVGLALGVAWVVWARRRSTPGTGAARRDRELLVADLAARQELLYQQLRDAEGTDRDELELAAARNLKALEEAGGRTPAAAPAPGLAPSPAPEPAPGEAAAPPRRGPSAVAGFVVGVACAALVGVLLVWAQRDAKPRPEEPRTAAPMAPGERHPEGSAELSEAETAALERIAVAVEGDPTDVMARKQYAVALLSTGQFFAAFEQAQILLASDAGDPDGLYVQGMVRMRMGQEAEARSLLARLVQDYPEHVPALTALGVLVLRSGGLEAADVYWDRAVVAAGGENPEVEQLRAAARRQLATGAPAAVAEEPRRPAPAADPRAYTLRLDLAPGAAMPPGGVLFVSLRQADSGPPEAVQRIADPKFPLTVTLGAADSMLGRPLPPAGTVSARIDSDGNVSTRAAGEPEGQVAMTLGETGTLTLQ